MRAIRGPSLVSLHLLTLSFFRTAKTKPTYTRRSSTGGYTTLALILISTILSVSEFLQWYRGHENQHFSVEKGVSHTLQINLDMVMPMQCSDIHINVQDASGDMILAGDLLNREPTNWGQWADGKSGQRVHALDSGAMESQREEDTHVGHVLGEVGGRGGKRKFPKTPKLRGAVRDSCRVFGSLEGNKVQGDFHITARGHGYKDFGEHLDHSGMFWSFSSRSSRSRAPQLRNPTTCLPLNPNHHHAGVPPHIFETARWLERFTLTRFASRPAFNFSHIINELSF